MTSNSAVLPNSAILQSLPSALTESALHTQSVPEVSELKELLRLTDDLPAESRSDFYAVLARLAAKIEHRQRMLGYVQDSLNQMSLDLKYLIFDLEATRRERDAYQQLLRGL